MPKPQLPTPSSARSILAAIVATPARVEREKLARPLGEAYLTLAADIEALGGDPRDVADALRPELFVRRLSAEVVKAEKKEDRRRAADRLLDAYTALFYARDDRAAKAKVRTGGRSGTVRFTDGKAITGNSRLDQLIEAERVGRDIDLNERIIVGGGGEEEVCIPQRIFVSVDKPGDLASLRDAGLDPEFLEYLRLTEKLYLRSIEEWLAHEGVDPGAAPNDAQRREFEQDRAKTFDAFAKERFQGKYCRPGDIPAQTGQRGHRLVRLALPLREEDFRDAGCGPEIYEGPFGEPIPPDIDYGVLVERYIKNLRALPRQYYNLEGLSELEVQAAHARDLVQADPLIARMFVAATLIALAHPAFLQRLSAFAQREG
jgi:hypothetical protein